MSNTSESASQWLAKLERGLRAEEGASLQQWLTSSANRKAIVETARLLHGPDVNAILAQLIPASVAAANKTPRSPQRALTALYISGAVVCAAAFGVILPNAEGDTLWTHFQKWRQAQQAPPTQTFTTGIGETRAVKLPDGSTITLNTGTRVYVTYSALSRDLNLAYGEATFTVAPEAARPFNVAAGKRQFQAVGTSFNLRTLSPLTVELTVTEGKLKLLYAPPQLPATPAQRREEISYGEETVGALEAALVEPGFQFVSNLEASELEDRLAWQRGLIVFDHRALEDVIAEVERYTPTKFVLSDKRLRDIRVSGRFRIGNVNALRLALRQQYNISSRRDAEGRVVLTAVTTL